MSSSSFPVASLGVSMYRIVLSTNCDRFISFFLIWIASISFYSMASMGRKDFQSYVG